MKTMKTKFMDLPGELLLWITDGSLTTTVLLASTNFDLRWKIMLASKRVDFRLVCQHALDAVRIERTLGGRFRISELIITGNCGHLARLDVLEQVLLDCPLVKSVHVNPEFAFFVKDWYSEHPIKQYLILLKKQRGFEIKVRVAKQVKPAREPQPRLTLLKKWPLHRMIGTRFPRPPSPPESDSDTDNEMEVIADLLD